MSNQVINVMSTVITNTNTKNNTIMFNLTDSLHTKKTVCDFNIDLL